MYKLLSVRPVGTQVLTSEKPEINTLQEVC